MSIVERHSTHVSRDTARGLTSSVVIIAEPAVHRLGHAILGLVVKKHGGVSAHSWGEDARGIACGWL